MTFIIYVGQEQSAGQFAEGDLHIFTANAVEQCRVELRMLLGLFPWDLVVVAMNNITTAERFI